MFLKERINEAAESSWYLFQNGPQQRESRTAVGLWSVGHAALSVTCQGLFVIFVPSDAGHRRCSSQESDCLHL